MKLIAAMALEHETSTTWGIGRYDDSFNINCTGLLYYSGVPTMLFEAGHYPMIMHEKQHEPCYKVYN